MIQRLALLSAAVLWCSGCGGYYIMNVPDQVARTDGQIVPVARLQRNDMFVMAVPQTGSPMRFRLDGGELKACGTDELGYAAVQMPAPDSPGKHQLYVAMLDPVGEEVSATVPVFVWDPSRPVVAVDLDAVPPEGWTNSSDAAAALNRIARKANVLYFTRNSARTQQRVHERFVREGYPDGPILLWQRQRWHITREGRLGIPRVVIEQRLLSQLPVLRDEFPNLTLGICRSETAAQAFVDAGMRALVIGRPGLTGSNLLHRDSWADLARGPLPSFVSPDAPTKRPQLP
ncbi:MAG: hypothetical protein GVY16_09930 [Planctomycetes bacterium]|nr:hypothetical protein [Planctomycetota bacterium]